MWVGGWVWLCVWVWVCVCTCVHVDTENKGDEHDNTAKSWNGLQYSRNNNLEILQKPKEPTEEA